MFGSSVKPVNVHLVEPICEGFGCSAGTFDTDMAGVIVAVGEDCDLMYGSVVWSIVQGAYAQCALATYSLTNLSHCRWVRLARFPSLEGPTAVSAGSRRSLDLETPVVVTGGTGFIGVHLAKALGAGTVLPRQREMAVIS